MSNTTVIYRSSDSSAPALEGVTGSLVTLLDACLVNGYGSQSGAGWTIAYTNTSKRVYRNSTSLGTGFYLNVDDSASASGAVAQEALMTGFQSATAIGTGTGQFPTSAQLNYGIGAVVCRKSNTASSTTRNWTLIADPTCFYLFVETGDYTAPIQTCCFMFGDFYSYSSTDTHNCMIVGRNTQNSSSNQYEWSAIANGLAGNYNSPAMTYTLCGHFIASNFTGTGGSIIFGKHIDATKSGFAGCPSFSGTSAVSGNGGQTIGGSYVPANALIYPNPANNGLYLSPVWIHHNGMLRGYFKGLWAPVQSMPLNHDDTYNGTGSMSAKSFVAQYIVGYNGSNGAADPGELIVETSSTWS